MNAIQSQMPLIMQVNESALTKPKKANETLMQKIESKTVFLRRFGIVSESSEIYNTRNLLTQPETIRPALNSLRDVNGYNNEGE